MVSKTSKNKTPIKKAQHAPSTDPNSNKIERAGVFLIQITLLIHLIIFLAFSVWHAIGTFV